MHRLRLVSLGFVAVVVTAFLAGSVRAAPTSCRLDDTSRKTVLPGVTLKWDSAFRCANAPDSGSFEIVVRVSNAAGSAEAVRVDRLKLRGTTPRPRGRAPAATAVAQGLPIVVKPGKSKSFTVSGTYELVSTDEGDKANVHLRAHGRGAATDEPFKLGINVHLRGPSARER